MKFIIRQETIDDYTEIYSLIKTAFETAKVKDGSEQDFAEKLREKDCYIPELALVAETPDNRLIGHIMLTKTYIETDNGLYEALLIAPVSVLLECRNMGVGSSLVREGFKRAEEMGYKAVFLCGDPAYYHRFGFRPTSEFGIKSKQDIPAQYVMGCELEAGALEHIMGVADFV